VRERAERLLRGEDLAAGVVGRPQRPRMRERVVADPVAFGRRALNKRTVFA
jgi:hypothetical protein